MGDLFKEIVVWKRIEEKVLIRYRCLQNLSDERYFVKSSDYCSYPIDEKMSRQQEFYYLDSLSDAELDQVETYSTIEEAVLRHEDDFEEAFPQKGSSDQLPQN